jgi:long-chain acyl-CoA synthetase
MRVAEDGEILFRAPNVMAGYFKNAEETAAAIDGEGWLHTGDIGEIDAEDYLRITDRKKDLIITAGGKNVAPQRVERALCASAFIAQAMVFGDRRKYLVGLLVVDLGAVQRWALTHGLDIGDAELLVADPRVRAHLHAEVDAVNERLAPFESVKNFHLLAREFGIDSGELTATMKLRRRVVTERYRSVLEALYPR